MEGIVMITAVLQTIVLLHRRRINQPKIVSLCLQSIDQPVPVKSGLHSNTPKAFLERRQGLECQ